VASHRGLAGPLKVRGRGEGPTSPTPRYATAPCRLLSMRGSQRKRGERRRRVRRRCRDGFPNRHGRLGGVATPRGATIPPMGSRAGPLSPAARTPKAASGKKVVITPKRVATTPGAKGRASAGTAPVAETAEASSKKGGKKVRKGAGVDTPTPVPSRSAIRARPPVTPTTPSSAARPVDKKTSGWKKPGGNCRKEEKGG